MKIYPEVSFLILLLVFGSCSGSDEYIGNWKATNPNGEKFNIQFEPETLTIISAKHDTTIIGYNQLGYTWEGGIETFGIKLDDGRRYDVKFPVPTDSVSALILEQTQQTTLYVLHRTEFKDFYDVHRIEK